MGRHEDDDCVLKTLAAVLEPWARLDHRLEQPTQQTISSFSAEGKLKSSKFHAQHVFSLSATACAFDSFKIHYQRYLMLAGSIGLFTLALAPEIFASCRTVSKLLFPNLDDVILRDSFRHSDKVEGVCRDCK